MGQLLQPNPLELPGDAVFVLSWSHGEWRTVAVGTGYTAMSELGPDLKDAFPWLDGTVVVAVKPQAVRMKRFEIDEQITRTLTELDPAAAQPGP